MPITATSHFTRFIVTIKLAPERTERLTEIIEAVEARCVPTRKEPQPVWTPLAHGAVRNQVEFLLPWVSRYIRGEVPDDAPHRDRDCTALAWHPNQLGQLGVICATSPQAKRHQYAFTIAATEVYFFSTGIVAVAVECALRGNGDMPLSLDHVANFNYDMQHFDSDRAMALTAKPGKSDTPGKFLPGLTSEEGTTLFELLKDTLAPVFEGPHEVLDRRGFRLLTFVSLAEGTSPDGADAAELGEKFFWLRRVTKESYLAAPVDLPLEGRPDTIRTFANTFVGFSLEGMAVLAIRTGHPFDDERPNRVRHSHFAHYLLALHQRAALLSLALDAGNLPRITPALVDHGSDLVKRITDLRLRAVDFNLHHRFSQVSTMTHYAGLYGRLVDALAIPALVDEVRDEIAELEEVLRLHRESRERARAARVEESRRQVAEAEDSRDKLLARLIALLGPLSILISLYGTNLPHYAQPTYNSGFFLVPLAICLIMTAALWWSFRKSTHGSDVETDENAR